MGYVLLSVAPALSWAIFAVVVAHGGSSVVWVFSTTLLHYQTADRFRGRVFSADFAFLVLAMAAVSYTSGAAVDFGVSVRTISMITGSAGDRPGGAVDVDGLAVVEADGSGVSRG